MFDTLLHCVFYPTAWTQFLGSSLSHWAAPPAIITAFVFWGFIFATLIGLADSVLLHSGVIFALGDNIDAPIADCFCNHWDWRLYIDIGLFALGGLSFTLCSSDCTATAGTFGGFDFDTSISVWLRTWLCLHTNPAAKIMACAFCELFFRFDLVYW